MPRIRAATIAEHKALTRESILDAAHTLFVIHGLAGTSLADVASVAGVGRTTLYDYFANKEELLLTLLETRIPPVLEAAIAVLPTGTPAARIEATFRAAFQVVAEHFDLACVLFCAGRELPYEARQRMWRVLQPFHDELRTQCERGLADGSVRRDDPALLYRTIADLLVGAVELVLTADYTAELAERVLESRLGFLAAGIAS